MGCCLLNANICSSCYERPTSPKTTRTCVPNVRERQPMRILYTVMQTYIHIRPGSGYITSTVPNSCACRQWIWLHCQRTEAANLSSHFPLSDGGGGGGGSASLGWWVITVRMRKWRPRSVAGDENITWRMGNGTPNGTAPNTAYTESPKTEWVVS